MLSRKTNIKMKSPNSVTPLTLTMAKKLIFDLYISKICKAASAKFKSLSRIRNSIEEKEDKLFYSSLISLRFRKCSVLWFFCILKNRTDTKKMHKSSVKWTPHATWTHEQMHKCANHPSGNPRKIQGFCMPLMQWAICIWGVIHIHLPDFGSDLNNGEFFFITY